MTQYIPPPTAKPVVSASTVRTVTADTTAVYGEAILVDATAGNRKVTLPTAQMGNARITIKKIDSSANTVTVQGGGTSTIDGGPTFMIQAQYTSRDFATNGTNWFTI